MLKYLLLLLFSSCIVITSRGPDDGYVLADKAQLSGFRDSIAVSDTFKIVEIRADELKSVLPKSGNAVVILWASWCGRCLVELPYLIEESKTRSIYFVSSDYGLKRMNKEFKGYQKPIYVVSSTTYGPNEIIKNQAFLHGLSAKLDSVPVAFPKHLYFKQGEFAGVIEGQLSTQVLDSLLSK
ncbi:MAG: TlpA family protein disulfide reductase [Bacteroidia bacterium]